MKIPSYPYKRIQDSEERIPQPRAHRAPDLQRQAEEVRPPRAPYLTAIVFGTYAVATSIFVQVGAYPLATVSAMWAFGYLLIFECRRPS